MVSAKTLKSFKTSYKMAIGNSHRATRKQWHGSHSSEELPAERAFCCPKSLGGKERENMEEDFDGE